MNSKLKKLFYNNYKPCKVLPVLGLTEYFILNNGFSKEDIENLILHGFIEKVGNGYRMTQNTLKEWMEENSWAYRTFVIKK